MLENVGMLRKYIHDEPVKKMYELQFLRASVKDDDVKIVIMFVVKMLR